MKKVFTLTLMLLLIVFSVSAISIDDVKNNPRFIKISSDINTETYLDLHSIRIQRYDPPYYMLDMMSVEVNYNRQIIRALHYRVTYDYNYSKASYYDLIKSNPNSNITLTQFKAHNSGMTEKNGPGDAFYFNGKRFAGGGFFDGNTRIPYNTPHYLLCAAAFKHVYNIDF